MRTVLPITSRSSGELSRLLEERGIGQEDYQNRLIERIDALVAWIRNESVANSATYPITVDYGQNLAQMIEVGKYDWVNSDITAKNFPTKGKGKDNLETEIVHFGRSMSSEQVLADLDKMGLRPATLPELLAFGAKHPELQRQFPIVALGSVSLVHGNRGVAYLYHDERERYLFLDWFDCDWYDYVRFLAVRK